MTDRVPGRCQRGTGELLHDQHGVPEPKMKPPIITDDRCDFSIFETVEEAEKDVEPMCASSGDTACMK